MDKKWFKTGSLEDVEQFLWRKGDRINASKIEQ